MDMISLQHQGLRKLLASYEQEFYHSFFLINIFECTNEIHLFQVFLYLPSKYYIHWKRPSKNLNLSCEHCLRAHNVSQSLCSTYYFLLVGWSHHDCILVVHFAIFILPLLCVHCVNSLWTIKAPNLLLKALLFPIVISYNIKGVLVNCKISLV